MTKLMVFTTRRFTLALGFAALAVCSTGCFVGTPKEQIRKLGGRIVTLGPGEIKLILSGSRLTDSDMHFVSALCSNHSEYKAIRELDLTNTDLSDEGLEILMHVDTLRELNVSNTRVTEAGIRKFRAAVPTCHIVRD